MSKGKKNSVQCIKQDEPAFIRRFKQQVGYKEGPSVDDKRAALERDDTGSDLEDEKPSIVVLKKGDLTAEDVEELKKQGKSFEINDSPDEKEEEPPADGRIIFKKPKKRSNSSQEDSDKKKKVKKIESKKVKNKALLSFNEEEEDDD